MEGFRKMTKCSCGHNKGDHKAHISDRKQAKYDVNFNLKFYCKFCDCTIDQFGEISKND